VAARCGDGIVHAGVETCDDGNDSDEDACLSTCVPASCGDGIVQADAGEECDDGEGNGDGASCLSNCLQARCGDGFVHEGVEECDEGDANAEDGACLPTCVAATCGDGFVRAGVEACDDGNDDDTDGCLSTCEVARCGDGFVQEGVELCDDGNDDDTDGCPSTCVPARCGDGFVHEGIEQCDDGNDVDTDGCLSTCMVAFCGDGVVHAGVEQCDDGNDIDTDDCTSNCTTPVCGDGFVHEGHEACDDGNGINTDECPTNCEEARCGDGYVWAGVELCDRGAANADTPGAVCRTDCTPARCGDGIVDPDEACDDGNGIAGDGCSPTCEHEGESCASPIFLASTSETFTVSGDTRLFGNNLDLDFCTSPTATNRDVVYAFTSPIAARWRFDLTSDGTLDAVFAVLQNCAPPFVDGDQLHCVDGPAENATETITVDLAANQTVFLVVDGFDDDDGARDEGTFTLTGTPTPIVGAGQSCVNAACAAGLVCNQNTFLCATNVCGDGVRADLERCDDGNTVSGDGCTFDCQFEGDLCATAGTLPVRADGTVRFTGNTVGLGADYDAWCASDQRSSNSADAVFAFTSPTEANWTFRLEGSFNTVLAIQTACGNSDTNLACESHVTPVSEASVRLGAGETVYILVDGYGWNERINEGEFILTGTSTPVQPPGSACTSSDTCAIGSFCYELAGLCVNTCGNGIVDAQSRESCDDGNQLDGDGCSANCLVAPNYACPVAGQPCRPIVCGDGHADYPETCDDGNTVSGDGCDSSCQIETIALPGPGSSVVITGELTTSDPTWAPPGTTCATTTRTGNWYYDVHYFRNDGPTDLVIDFYGRFGASNLLHMFNLPWNPATPTVNCTQASSGVTASKSNVTVPAGATVAIVVSSGAAERVGSYTLTVSSPALCGDGIWGTDEVCDTPAVGCTSACQLEPGYSCDRATGNCFIDVCGDGIVGESEACDDGNTVDDDLCNNQCQLNGDDCGSVAHITPDPVTGGFMIRGDTRLATHHDSVGCVTSTLNGDLVYAFTAPVGGTWRFVASTITSFTIALEVRADCSLGSSALACAGSTSVAGVREVELDLNAGETVYLLVTGYGSTTVNVGDFYLQGWVTPFATAGEACGTGLPVCGPGLTCDGSVCVAAQCGNGTPESKEECDDGNTIAGDGCDASCKVEAVAIATAGSSIVFEDSIDETDPTWSPPSSTCTSTTRSGDWYYDVYHIRNESLQPQTVEVRPTSFGTTALLFVYDLPFDPASQLDNCRKGSSGVAPSLTDVYLGPGEAKAIVIGTGTTTTRAIGEYQLRITTRPVCGDGIWGDAEACDDGGTLDGDGCSALCTVETGYTCNRALGTCTLNFCGDGLAGAGEACDDGNQIEDDLCTSQCTWNGDTCASPAILAVTGESFTVQGNTAGLSLDYQTGCANTSNSPDVFYSFTAPIHGRWRFALRAPFDSAIAVATTCGDPSTELACADKGASNAKEEVEVVLTQGQTVIIVVDGFGSTTRHEGPFTLTGTVRPIRQAGEVCDPAGVLSTCDTGLVCNADTLRCDASVCGNGVQESGEECDDGNTDAGDGCTACRIDAIPIAGPGSAITLTGSLEAGDTTWAPPLAACTSTSRTGDWFHDAFVIRNTDTVPRTVDITSTAMQTTALLFVYDAPFDPTLPLVGCTKGSSSATPSILDLELQPGEAKVIVMSTGTTTQPELGPYQIRVVTEGVCGDGIFGNAEACDDGNNMDGDGCSASCTVESGYSCTPAMGCFFSTCGDGIVGNGEDCDDGNLDENDGCTSSCTWSTGSCADPMVITSTAASPSFVVKGSTAGAPKSYTATCGTTGNSGERFLTFTAPVRGIWTFRLRGEGYDSALAVTTVCGNPLGELACAEQGSTGAEDVVTLELDAGQTVFLVADGYSTTSVSHEGRFTLTGEVAPIVGAGAGCDPAGKTSRCDVGLVCDGTSASPICIPAVCGNGVLESGEECDDGNLTNNDGCSAGCRLEGTCDVPWVVTAAADNTLTVQADTTGRPKRYNIGCAYTFGSPEIHFTFTAPVAGRWQFVVTPTGFDSALAVTRTCGVPGDSLACVEENASGGTDTVVVSLDANETVFLVVDGYGSSTTAQGPFVLTGTVTPYAQLGAACDPTGQANECAPGLQCDLLTGSCVATVCGNGVVQPGEECDEGAANGTGTCSIDCKRLGDTCAAPFDLRALDTDPSPTTLLVTGNTANFNNDHVPSCFGGYSTTTNQRDVVYAIHGNGVTDEVWTLSLESASTTQLVLDVQSDCVHRNARIACSPDIALNAPYTTTFRVGANDTVYVWVDSETATTTGYTIRATIQDPVPLGGFCDPTQGANTCAAGLGCSQAGVCVQPVCGDGVVEGDEQCDEGPLGGNGCTADCYREGDTCNAPYDLNVVGATPASGRWQHAGSLLGMTANYIPSCSNAGGYNDVVYVFTAPYDGTYTFAETSSMDVVMSITADCPDTSPYDLICTDSPETISLYLHANETVFLHMDRYGSTTQGPPPSGATDYAFDVYWSP